MSKRANGAFRALLEAGAHATTDECMRADRAGRPTYCLNGIDMNASRAVWWIANGDPGRMHVLHRCGDDQCLNVRHLYLGTDVDNARDTVLMDRCANAVVPLNVARQIACRYVPGKKGLGNGNVGQLATEYGVSRAAIRGAARRIHRIDREQRSA